MLVSADPGESLDRRTETVFLEYMKSYCTRKRLLHKNKKRSCNAIWGQGTDATKSNLQSSPTFDQREETDDGSGVLHLIKELIYMTNDQKYKHDALYEATRGYFLVTKRASMKRIRIPQVFQFCCSGILTKAVWKT